MTLAIPRLQRNIPITSPAFLPSESFQIWWQKVAKSLQDAIVSLEDQLTQIQDTARLAARTSSYTSPTNVLTATDAGSDATITIAPHDRIYPSNSGLIIPTVSLVGGNILHLAYSTLYFVYYDDATLANTAPTFLTTTVAETAAVGAGTARHFLGAVTTPAHGGAPSGGMGGLPPGGGGGEVLP